MILGFGNWIKAGSPAVTVLFADSYNGRQNAPADENVALPDRPGISGTGLRPAPRRSRGGHGLDSCRREVPRRGYNNFHRNELDFSGGIDALAVRPGRERFAT